MLLRFENSDLKLALQCQSEGRSPATEISLLIEMQRCGDHDEPYRGYHRPVILLPDGSGKPREIRGPGPVCGGIGQANFARFTCLPLRQIP